MTRKELVKLSEEETNWRVSNTSIRGEYNKKGRNLSYASGIKFAGKNVDIKAGIPESSTMFKLAENSSKNGESLGKILFHVHVV